jgi:cobalt transport protein
LKEDLVYAAALGFFFALLALAGSNQAGTGTDDLAKDAVLDITRGSYHPWLSPPWQPGESQGMFFGLQAGLGGAVLGYFLCRYRKGSQSHPKR